MRSVWTLVLAQMSFTLCLLPAMAVDLIVITPENYSDIVPSGKEVDAIYGDWVLRNDKIAVVVASPTPGRKANMTVRGVGGMVIDFTTRYDGSDQLSCFYPGGGRYLFEDASTVSAIVDKREIADLEGQPKLNGKSISLTLIGSPVADDGTLAKLTYRLEEGKPCLEYSVSLTNRSEEPREMAVEDSIRVDGNLFEKGVLENGAFFAQDLYFGQCYGVQNQTGGLSMSSGRNIALKPADVETKAVEPGKSIDWSGIVVCSQGLPGVRGVLESLEKETWLEDTKMILKSPQGPITHASIEYFRGDESLGKVMTDERGIARSHLVAGRYLAKVAAIGFPKRAVEFSVENGPRADTLSFEPASRVRAKITDGDGRVIAAKVQFIGRDGTVDPNFGPDSAIAAVGNAVYCAQGEFEQPIDPGKYTAIISHGPEYDADRQQIVVEEGKLLQLNSSIARVVDTSGWISSEFHSHSSPSGDNVSHQTGRVLNLLAEHLEFAPCTEHNRIDTYEDDLELLGASQSMATCTGMELTGGPLPINHQNAFPLHRHEHTQDGGGPDTDKDPVKQIERLALWDNSSEKVVQTNHPNIPSILGDKDLDGKPDGGFRGMLGWMDVIEVHPPEGIFETPDPTQSPDDKRKNPILHWMRLLNLGYRISGVVNTDAHYNFHGSGWLRNYMLSSNDDPSQIDIGEMIHAAEDGHMVMTTGPFLQAEIRTTVDGESQTLIVGDDMTAGFEDAQLWIRVQCPNWFDVNRVQVFANGRAMPNLNFTRKTHSDMFSESAVRFEATMPLPEFDADTHLIIATIGEGLKLGPVMGTTSGELPPVAVTNPIFLDVDGAGFQANGDDLGIPFMLDEARLERASQ